MQSLESMEQQCKALGGCITQSVGSHVVQVVKEPGYLGGGSEIVYRLNGWPVPRTHIIRALAGVIEHRETYQEMLENRVGAGLTIGPVTSGG